MIMRPCNARYAPVPRDSRDAFADLPRVRAGGTDGSGPSMSPVRLPEGDDLFGLGMTGFVPGEALGANAGASPP